ncbi:MAG TPA: hypothetical protein VHL31_21725 [Geminicoccus sp.]|jgi:hypothetical protein|nr:hypothetical protein [Geminicoccus sp.]HEX2528899.1 hypothetical protein [Geminicoccus sp.]
MPSSQPRQHLSLLHRAATDRLIPVAVIVLGLWIAVAWATGLW